MNETMQSMQGKSWYHRDRIDRIHPYRKLTKIQDKKINDKNKGSIDKDNDDGWLMQQQTSDQLIDTGIDAIDIGDNGIEQHAMMEREHSDEDDGDGGIGQREQE